jgi:hypothetical protein
VVRTVILLSIYQKPKSSLIFDMLTTLLYRKPFQLFVIYHRVQSDGFCEFDLHNYALRKLDS